MNKAVVLASIFLSILTFGPAHAADAAFPHRAHFKQVPIMEVEQLHRDLDKVTVVDVRTRYEYDTLHIKGAIHIPLSKTKLPAAVRELRKESNKPIVFYCNGHSCKKSYEAAEFAVGAGITNVYAYDAGLDTWTKQFPDQSVLLGQSPIKSTDLIDTARFKSRLLAAAEFEGRMEKGALVLDIRDLRQRDVALFPFKERRATLDEMPKITEVINEAMRLKKTLLVYDKVGKQTRWFQYFLEKQGIKDYFFLDGGAEAFAEAKYGKLPFKLPDQS
jgi:rhodanese-related sulfurtransferase